MKLPGIRETALQEPLLVHRLINKEGSVTAINVTVKLPGEDTATEIPEVSSFGARYDHRF